MKNITIITFAVFLVEAIVHYNLGAKSKGIPPKKQLLKLSLIVFVFSLINTALIKEY